MEMHVKVKYDRRDRESGGFFNIKFTQDDLNDWAEQYMKDHDIMINVLDVDVTSITLEHS